MNIFTRRERHIVLIVILLSPIFLILDQQTINDWELAWLLFFVLPAGIYILTDPERLGKHFKNENHLQ